MFSKKTYLLVIVVIASIGFLAWNKKLRGINANQDTLSPASARLPDNLSIKYSQFLIEGFNFALLQKDPAVTWKGPHLGYRIEVEKLSTNDGKKIGTSGEISPLIMLTVIDPNCEMCSIALQELQTVRDKIKDMGIEYYLVSFDFRLDRASFFNYAKSLNLGDKIACWDKDISLPPNILFEMVRPSHILVNSKGVVLRSWPGTSPDVQIQQKMANQITNDALVISDVIKTIK